MTFNSHKVGRRRQLGSERFHVVVGVPQNGLMMSSFRVVSTKWVGRRKCGLDAAEADLRNDAGIAVNHEQYLYDL